MLKNQFSSFLMESQKNSKSGLKKFWVHVHVLSIKGDPLLDSVSNEDGLDFDLCVLIAVKNGKLTVIRALVYRRAHESWLGLLDFLIRFIIWSKSWCPVSIENGLLKLIPKFHHRKHVLRDKLPPDKFYYGLILILAILENLWTSFTQIYSFHGLDFEIQFLVVVFRLSTCKTFSLIISMKFIYESILISRKENDKLYT